MTAKYTQPEEIRLSNGIPVILQHYEGLVAACYWWIQTGSADEAPKEAGFAHFLEHMLFKDATAKETGRASSGKMARAIESLGGDINAYTSFDQTVYHVTCAAQHWEKVLDIFGGMALQQKFSSEDFNREREVILEELRKNEDSPGRQLFQKLFSTTFEKHPYGRPVIGFEKILKKARVQEVEGFFRRQYTAGKMGLILVGPLTDAAGEKQGTRKKELIRILERRYGSKVFSHTPRKTAKTMARAVTRPTESPLRKQGSWHVQPFDVKTPTLSLSFRVPELGHPDLPALDLACNILGTGELSRLYQRLFYKDSLVVDVSAGVFVPKDPGMLYVQAEVDSMEKIQPAYQAIFEEINRLENEGPTPEELKRVLINAESEKLYSTQSADGVAGRLGFLRFTMGDLNYDQNYLDELRSVDSEKIKTVVKQYFDYRRMSGVVLAPKSAPQWSTQNVDQMAAQLLKRESHLDIEADEEAQKTILLSHSIPSALKKKTNGNLAILELPSGLRGCFFPRPQSHVFSIHASTLGGLRLELTEPMESAEKDWGTSYLMAMTWPKGTPQYSGRDILALTEGKAASIDGFSGRNSVGLQMTGLARDWNILSSLFQNVLLNPTFPTEEIEHSRRIAEDSINSVEDHSSQLCSKLFLETLYQTHPYGRMTHGSLESLPFIHQNKLKYFHKKWLRPDRLVISVSGAISKLAFESFLHAIDRELARNEKDENALHGLSTEAPLRAPRWVEKSLGREQAHIIVGGLGTRIQSEDRHVLRLLQMVLGGQSGRLFIELREKKSLAYTVSPIHFEGLEDGYIGTYIACAPDKREQAIEGIQHVLETLAKKGPTAQEMKRTKEFFLGRRAMDLQGDSSLASHYGLEALYHVPFMSEEELAKKIYKISAKEIQSACRKYLVEPFNVTSVVG